MYLDVSLQIINFLIINYQLFQELLIRRNRIFETASACECSHDYPLSAFLATTTTSSKEDRLEAHDVLYANA